ncbi:hypothetical protein M0802_002265 [Mischocyttarus mexicanus]|nr:hypothetical protein M0802_002265 [Mischocyttarus mexicanus]
MKTFILITLIALSVEANNWQQYPHWNQNGYPRYPHPNYYQQQNNFPKQNNPDQYIIDQSIANAEWICRNQITGDISILAPKTNNQRKNQAMRPSDHSFPDFVPEQDQKNNENNGNQENINSPDSRTVVEDVTKPSDVKYHGGEGIINVRLGAA